MKASNLQWLLALAGSAATFAQPPKPPGDRRPPPVPPILAIFDANQDKELSADEIAAASEALGKLDKDGDGKITLKELHTPPADGKKPKRPPHGKPPLPPVVAALDTDHDGTISATELAAAPDSLKVLDKDGDGALSPAELHPQGPPPRREGEQGGDDGPQGPPPGDEAQTEGVE